MNGLAQAVWVETLKARRSPLPLFTALGISMGPLVGAFFMIVLRDPELAQRVGLISAKAQLTFGSATSGADWPTYLAFLGQVAAVGGAILFGLITSWVFGREYSDRTVKDLLALPTPRASIVLAKYVVVMGWCFALTALIYLIGLGVGSAIALEPATSDEIARGTFKLLVISGLTIALLTPVAFFASAGHGYLPPMGAVFLFLALAQVVAVAGWGEYFPWSVPALYSEMGGSQMAELSWVSFALVALTALLGLAATLLWWEQADQTH